MNEYETILTIKYKDGSVRAFTLKAEDEINIKNVPISKQYEDNWHLIDYNTGKVIYSGNQKKLEFQKKILNDINPNKKYVIINHKVLDTIIDDYEV